VREAYAARRGGRIHPPESYDRSPRPMYAIVKTGGKQYKVAEGDVIEVEKLAGAPGDGVTLAAVLLVDGAELVSDAAGLAGVAVTGEVVAHTKGPKIRIHKFKNKTGYHKRQGHRQQLTVLKVTGIK
jgi:large subunit ribosomal protein L21